VNAGTLQFSSASDLFNQSGGTTTIAAGSTVNLPNSGQFIISGGTISLAPSATTAGSLNIVSLLWPNPSMAMNPATDVASINTLAYLAGQTPGEINLGNGERTFNIADPNATLTITATLTNGSLDKTGPGTLLLNGTESLGGTLNVAAGTVTIGSGTSFTNNIPITVASGATLNVMASIPNDAITNNGTVNFPAQSTAGIHLIDIAGLTLSLGQTSTVGNPALHSNRTLLEIGSLTFGGTTNGWQGLLDLTGNDLDLPGASLTNVSNQVKQGYNGGNWQGAGGIISSAATADTTHLTALGVIQNNQNGPAVYGSGAGQVLFDGIAPGASDVLVKFTYYGDTNLDGKVDGSDYSRIDAAYLADQTNPGKDTGWYNGDFNYDGIINGSDYTLIDNAYNTQGASLAAAIANPAAVATAQIGAGTSVPEPGALSLLGMITLGLLRRRSGSGSSGTVAGFSHLG
jgi:autotransporter-associated beta strand protein